MPLLSQCIHPPRSPALRPTSNSLFLPPLVGCHGNGQAILHPTSVPAKMRGAPPSPHSSPSLSNKYDRNHKKSHQGINQKHIPLCGKFEKVVKE